MKILTLASLLLAVAAWSGTADAATAATTSSDCAAKAVGKDGKALAGAAKNAFMKKCEAETQAAPSSCSAKALDKTGKPLAGAAKASFMKKCEADAKAAK